MSEEELNQELSTDDLKDVSGGHLKDEATLFKKQQYGLRNEKKFKRGKFNVMSIHDTEYRADAD